MATKPSKSSKPETSDPSAFSMHVARKAPKFLDESGDRLEDDPLKAVWDNMREAFSRLHGQRILEVMEHVFAAMPAGEKIWMDWVSDESSEFFLRFSNGWSLANYTNSADEESSNWSFPGPAAAPAWFPRDDDDLHRWMRWHSILHQWTIDPSVDGLAQQRLHELCVEQDGLGKDDLPLIKATLLGPEWSSTLDFIEINAQVAQAPATKKPKRRM